MKKLTIIICLTLIMVCVNTVVTLGKSTSHKDQSEDAILCSSLYLISSSLTSGNKNAASALTSIQKVFKNIYSVNRDIINKMKITKGEVSNIRSDLAIKIGNKYDKNPNEIYALEMRCNAWREKIVPYLVRLGNTKNKALIHKTFLALPRMPETPSSDDPRWRNSKILVDRSIEAWTKLGRITPKKLGVKLKKIGLNAAKSLYQEAIVATQKKDWTTAFKNLTLVAFGYYQNPKTPHFVAVAAMNLGVLYFEGLGTPKNFEKSFYWTKKATDAGLPSAYDKLAKHYEYGKGVSKNLFLAHAWYQVSLEDIKDGANKKWISKSIKRTRDKLTPQEIADAQKLARECVRKKYTGC